MSSDRLMSLTTTTVLGKRKNRVTSETLLLQLSASESNHDQSNVSRYEPESEAESRQALLLNSGRKSEFVLVNGSLVKNTKKKFHCTFSGCDKSYSKPCRLEEHERSRTGEVNLSF
jgi:general transcription factor IIIA